MNNESGSNIYNYGVQRGDEDQSYYRSGRHDKKKKRRRLNLVNLISKIILYALIVVCFMGAVAYFTMGWLSDVKGGPEVNIEQELMK